MQSNAGASSLLHDLIDQSADVSPEYGNGLANHLPMALHAMHTLGASDERLCEFAKCYCTRLERVEFPQIDTSAWPDLRGQLLAYGSLERMFAARIAAAGRDIVLRETLPHLMPGVAANAFHGLIRSAHAVALGHDAELASALAYWAAAWLPMLPIEQHDTLPWPSMAFSDWVSAAYSLRSDVTTGRSLIVARMKDLVELPAFRALAPALIVHQQSILTMSRFAAGLYAQTGNFTVLHLITSSHALTVLRPWFNDEIAASRWFSVAFLAALRASNVSLGDVSAATCSPHTTSLSSAARDSHGAWVRLGAAAIASNDDHVAKIVYSAKVMFELTGDEVFLAAAAKGVSVQGRG